MLSTLDGPAQQVKNNALNWMARHDKHYAVYTGRAGTMKTSQAILPGLNHPTFKLLSYTQTQIFSLVQQIA